MGNRIRQLREEAGLSQEQLAERVGTSPQQISRLEKGDRRLTTDWMERIAPELGVDMAFLLAPLASEKGAYFINDRAEISLINLWRQMTDDERAGFLTLLRRVAAEDDPGLTGSPKPALRGKRA